MDRTEFTSPCPPEWPPESVWREVDEAAQVWEDLHADGRELHFDLDPQSGRLTIEMRDLEGNVTTAVSPSEALSIAAGSAPGHRPVRRRTRPSLRARRVR
jgi:hypothetical protein